VLVLLPPSEAKTARRRGRPVDLDGLALPVLTQARRQALAALAAASARPDALAVLGVGPSLQGEVDRNTRWSTQPAVPVQHLYSGVLYDALGLASLGPGAKRRARSRLLVLSAAWGALRMDDAVPAYRLSMSTSLTGLAGPADDGSALTMASFWRPHLTLALPPLAQGVIVDCRSSAYAAAWRPTGPLAARTVAIRVLREVDGRRSVVSHMAKHTRGLVARHLVSRPGRDPGSPQALAAALGEAFCVELGETARDGSRVLDVIVRD